MVIASSLRFFDRQSAHKMSISTIPTLSSSAKSLDGVKSRRSRRWLHGAVVDSLTYLLVKDAGRRGEQIWILDKLAKLHQEGHMV